MLSDAQIGVQSPTQARDLATAVPPLSATATCERARDAFDQDSGLFAVAIVDAEHRPIGLINRFKFLERLATRFGRELVLKKPVTELMELDPLILDEVTHIDELGTRLMSQQHRYVFDGFIVTRNEKYSGLGTGLIRALTERRHAELQQMALHDMLTGLPNRSLFEQHLADTMAAAGHGDGVAVLFLDLDRFKEINDTFGHRFGDLVLCGISQRLRAAVRQSDLVARLSGDEFAIVLPNIREPEDAAAVARVLLTSCVSPLLIEGREVVVSCSIGVAIHPQHGATSEALVRAADTAQYHAKESRNSWQAYHCDMQEWRSSTPGLSALRQALEQGQLNVHYQPIVSLQSGKVHSVEALIRWQHATGPVAAADIVTLAETSGLIAPLTEFVVRSSFAQMRDWTAQGHDALRLAINISAMQVNSGMVSMLERLLDEFSVDAARLDLEITERAAMRASPDAVRALEALRRRGVTLTLDDFGTGYSALSRLERLPIDAMKIDKAFLERVDVEGNGVIARAIIAMAHALGLTIVGEGVETEAQLEFLRREGCEFAQGYLLGRPGPPDTITL
jgi:diguanylate cyclase (GGDEF)-like protein